MVTNASDRIDAKRAGYLKEVPRWYSPALHLMTTIGLCAIGASTAVMHIAHAAWYEYVLTGLGTLIFTNVVEWYVHKSIMHRPRRGFRSTYMNHTPRHHGIYVADRMEIRDRREWKFVLMGVKDFTSLGVMTAAPAYAVGYALNNNIGWMFFAVQMLYIGTYELLHLAFHLPATHFARRLPFMERLRRHHQLHHDQGLMGMYNFNIFWAFSDRIFGTMAPANRAARREKAPRA